MIEHQVEQGSPEWFALRLGIPTASEFHKILTPTGKRSETAHAYALYLVAEKLLNRSLDNLDHIGHIQRGKEREPDAVAMYEFAEQTKTRPIGFITTDDGRMGASPDRLLIGQNGGLEIKCPSPQVHVGYMLDGFDLKYKPQVMGQMLICDLDFVDRYSFHPDMPPFKERTYRDAAYIRNLAAVLDEFCDIKDAMLERARASGFFEEQPHVLTATDTEYGDRIDA